MTDQQQGGRPPYGVPPRPPWNEQPYVATGSLGHGHHAGPPGKKSNKYFVTPEGTLIAESAVSSEQANAWHGPYGRGQANDVAKAIHSGRLAPTTQQAAAETAAAIRGVRQPRIRNRKDRGKIVGSAGTGVVFLIIGVIMQAATSSTYALCNSPLGAIGQAISSGAQARCGLDDGVHEFGSALVWIGVLALGAAVLGTLVAVASQNARR
jgi:hypothetical protein